MKKLASLGLCIMLSLMLVFGSVFSNPLTVANASSDGDGDNESGSQGDENDGGDSSDGSGIMDEEEGSKANADSNDNIDADEDQVQDDNEEICDNGIDDNGDGLIDKDDLEACPDESDEQDGDASGLGSTGGELFSPLGSGANEEVGGGQTLFDGENEQPLSEELIEFGTVVEVCDDGVDNDGDNLIDIADDECAGPQTQASTTTPLSLTPTPAPTPGGSPTSSNSANPYEAWHKVCIESGGCPTDPPCYEAPSTGSGLLDEFKAHCPEAQLPQTLSSSPSGGGSDANTITGPKPLFGTAPLGYPPAAAPSPDNQPSDGKPGQEPRPTEQPDILSDFRGLVPPPNDPDSMTAGMIKVSSKSNPDGSKTDIYIPGDNPFQTGTIEVTTYLDGTVKKIQKDDDQSIHLTSIRYPNESMVVVLYENNKPSSTVRYDSLENKVETIDIAPDDSFTKTSSYLPGIDTPAKVVTDYRDPPGRKITETFNGNVRKTSDYNPKDGWTTTRTTDQTTGSTTTEITKTNTDGSVSTKNPDNNAITTQNKDGSWYITFPPSQDGSVKTYHSDGRTTIEKPK